LLFVGRGELGNEIRKVCSVVFDIENNSKVTSNKGSGPPASFAGFLNQTEIAGAYVAADLLVLPSDSGETWGLVANEALACGTPVIASNLCGCAEDLVAPLDARFVFRCGDVADLAAAIRCAQQTQLSDQKVREIADTHHLRHTVNTVRDLYARVVRK
jgi:glycosyltransferase involved in cell wall biosynthesis